MTNQRITNIDTLSAFFDRLITENIKLFFFKKENKQDNVEHQMKVISEIKERIYILIKECLLEQKYEYLSEERTFDEDSIIEELEQLIFNDINIGESDRARLEQAHSKEPDLEKFIINEKRLRKANEGRAKNKNNIDKMFKKMVEK
tara:strand:- start:16070 stop:16507 length:438 start_codon:yes stop_codon:yes gene_type:complete